MIAQQVKREKGKMREEENHGGHGGRQKKSISRSHRGTEEEKK